MRVILRGRVLFFTWSELEVRGKGMKLNKDKLFTHIMGYSVGCVLCTIAKYEVGSFVLFACAVMLWTLKEVSDE